MSETMTMCRIMMIMNNLCITRQSRLDLKQHVLRRGNLSVEAYACALLTVGAYALCQNYAFA